MNIYKRILLGVVGLGLAACEQELLDPGAVQTAVGEGYFVVDYAAEEGATRAIHEKLDKEVRINSLTYLLYNEEGNLEKQREIPGLEGDDEVWPLRREHMSWEQREALKDTLLVGERYQVVFIANLEAWTAPDGSNHPLQEAQSFETAYLQLPSKPFTDRDMFYLFTTQLPEKLPQVDRDHPYSCPVRLQRIVTRTDLLFERLPDWELSSLLPDPPSGYPLASSSLPQGVEGYLMPKLSALMGSEWAKMDNESLHGQLLARTQAFLNALTTYFEKQKTLLPINPDQQAENKKWEGYKQGVTALLSSLNTEEGKMAYLQKLHEETATQLPTTDNLALEVHFRNLYLRSLVQNSLLQRRWRESWRDQEKKVYAQVDYATDAQQADRFFLNRDTKSSGKSQPIIWPVDATYEQQGKSYCGFHLVGFAHPSLNRMTEIRWVQQDGTPDARQTNLQMPEWAQTGQGANEWYRLLYTPLETLAVKSGKATCSTTVVCDLQVALPFDAVTNVDSSLLQQAINAALADEKDKTLNAFGPGPLAQIQLQIDYPDLSKEERLEIQEYWGKPERVVQ